MKLNLLSFNVRGLNDDSAVELMRSYLTNSQPSLDFVALQEHKICGSGTTRLGDRLWRGSQSFVLEALVGYGHDPSDPGAGCGGVITLINPKWASHIGATGSLMENRLHWVILKGLPGGDVGIANIYAPNESSARCQLWEKMEQELPHSCRWILIGDFNMVESRLDKTRQTAAMIPYRERLLFEGMKSALHVEDNIISPGSLKYSWDNNRPGLPRSLARLDRMYTFLQQPGSPCRSILTYSILANTTRSDHLPVAATIQFEMQPLRKSHWKMNATWFEAASEDISRIWAIAGPQVSFFAKMRNIIRFYKRFCKRKIMETRGG